MELHDDPIVMRPWREDDAQTVHAACQDAEIQRWVPDIPRPYSHADAHAFVTDTLGLEPHQFAITEHGTVVGSVGLRVGRHQTGHIGYWCAPESRGRGIMTRPPAGVPRRARPRAP